MSCASGSPNAGGAAEALPETFELEAIELKPLMNVYLVAPGVYSGSAPMDEAGYAALERLGVRTVLSVDGARPRYELGEAIGARIVHLPLRYSGIGSLQRAQLARALREAEAPVYVHCHHGLHRGPAAAAAALIGLGRMSTDDGIVMLERVGTGRVYTGLWNSVRSSRALSPAELDATPDISTNAASDVGLGEAMARIQIAWDELYAASERDWRADQESPGSAPVETAGEITETLRALMSGPTLDDEPADLRARMLDAIELAAALERALEVSDAPRASVRFSALSASCNSCHRVYRD